MTPCPKCGWALEAGKKCVMCGHVEPDPLEHTMADGPGPPPAGAAASVPRAKAPAGVGARALKPRAIAETIGSLSQTIAGGRAAQSERMLVGFVAAYVGGEPAGPFWPLYSGEITFGRAGGSGQADIALNAPSVSAKHARVVSHGRTGKVVLFDEGSRNGTEHNDIRVQAGQPQNLSDNDRIKLGHITLVVKLLPRIGQK